MEEHKHTDINKNEHGHSDKKGDHSHADKKHDNSSADRALLNSDAKKHEHADMKQHGHANAELNIQPELAKAIAEMGYTEYTDIQIKSIPLIQAGKDVIGQSFTGSGKTAAFGLPMLERIEHGRGIQCIVLVPTRELCEQVATELKKFSKYKKIHITSVYGGVAINPQMMHLRRTDVVVGTPGRVLDHLSRRTMDLSTVRCVVLDEADKMFEMGFVDDVRDIISHTPKERQTLLFSATMSPEVHEVVKHYMKHPEKVKVQTHVEAGKLTQQYYGVDSKDKFSMLVHTMKQEPAGLKIVFCATRNRADMIGRNLYKNGIKNEVLHGGLSQNKRKYAIDNFHKGEIDVLVASDIASRGLDIKNVNLIINYDLPKTAKEYTHRIGRTARAGQEGKVISLLSHEDHDNFRDILSDRSLVIEKLQLPAFERIAFSARSEGSSSGFGQRQGGRFGSRSGGSRGGYGGSSRGPPRGGSSGGSRGFGVRLNRGDSRDGERSSYGSRSSSSEGRSSYGSSRSSGSSSSSRGYSRGSGSSGSSRSSGSGHSHSR